MQSKIVIYQSDSQIVRDAIDKVIVKVYQKKREKNFSLLPTKIIKPFSLNLCQLLTKIKL